MSIDTPTLPGEIETVICDDCGGSLSGGYALVPTDGYLVCYACAGKRDRAAMRNLPPGGRYTLYLTEKTFYNTVGVFVPVVHPTTGYTSAYAFRVNNWPGTLAPDDGLFSPVGGGIIPHVAKFGRHNIAGTRLDVWFTLNGDSWQGTRYGSNTQILHCRKLAPKKRR